MQNNVSCSILTLFYLPLDSFQESLPESSRCFESAPPSELTLGTASKARTHAWYINYRPLLWPPRPTVSWEAIAFL